MLAFSLSLFLKLDSIQTAKAKNLLSAYHMSC